jgi:hypothetical protein
VPRFLPGLLAALGLLVLPACTHTRVTTHTPRTATEQLLVSLSAERAVDALALPGVEGRRVALEVVGVGRGEEFYTDLPYVQAALEDRLRRDGATLVETPEEAELVVAARVGTLGTTLTQSALGLPSVPIVVGSTPEITFYRSLTQQGYTRLRLAQRDASGATAAEEETVMERARYKFWKIFFLTFHSGDAYPKDLRP